MWQFVHLLILKQFPCEGIRLSGVPLDVAPFPGTSNEMKCKVKGRSKPCDQGKTVPRRSETFETHGCHSSNHTYEKCQSYKLKCRLAW